MHWHWGNSRSGQIKSLGCTKILRGRVAARVQTLLRDCMPHAETIDAIVEHATRAPTEASGITMIYWHGPWSSEPRDDAFGFRQTGYHYWIHSYWQRANEALPAQRWVKGFFDTLAPYSSGAVYVNDLQNEGQERVRAAYGDKYERLRALKRKYDPTNFFRVNQNIPPN